MVFRRWYFWTQCEKVGFEWEKHLLAKGTRKKLATKQGKMIWEVLVVYGRKYHIFLAPGQLSRKVEGGNWRVHLPVQTRQ